MDAQTDAKCLSKPVVTMIFRHGESTSHLSISHLKLRPHYFPVMWDPPTDSTSRTFVATITHDDVETLQRFSTAHKDYIHKSVVYWVGGMTALDYAEYLGDETEAEILRPCTKTRTERLTMSLYDYMNKYHPGTGLYKSRGTDPRCNNGYELSGNKYLESLDMILEAMEGTI